MNPIIHIAIRVPDLKKSIEFYETVFGYRVREIREYAGHRSCHLDGAGIDLASHELHRRLTAMEISGMVYRFQCIDGLAVKVGDVVDYFEFILLLCSAGYHEYMVLPRAIQLTCILLVMLSLL